MKKSTLITLITTLMLVLSNLAFSSTLKPIRKLRIADDREFSNPRININRNFDNKLTPDQVSINNQAGAKSVTVLITDHGNLREIEGVLFKSQQNPFQLTQNCTYTTIFTNTFYAIKKDTKPYEINFVGECNAPQIITFKPENPATHVLSIWRIAYLAGLKLKNSVGLDFWHERIDFVWPDDGDYYNYGSVHLTDGTHWDVVGHEMGHAIYDLAQIGDFGGGSHKIDQCYSDALALSEGWATYFSAWVSIDPNDPDAKFEYMVPRRAPIQIENIPSDVCRGVRSEWRVSSFFWDLYDLHDDVESAKINFMLTWKALLKKNIHNMQDAYVELHNGGLSKEIIKAVADHNFNN